MGEGGGFGWGGVEELGENADNCNRITIKIFLKRSLSWKSSRSQFWPVWPRINYVNSFYLCFLICKMGALILTFKCYSEILNVTVCTNSIQEFYFLNISPALVILGVLKIAILKGMRWKVSGILICIFLAICDIQHFFLYFLAINMSPLRHNYLGF